MTHTRPARLLALLVAPALGLGACSPASPPAPDAAAIEPAAAELCVGFGPQTPRDIANPTGANPDLFPLAASPRGMNLCNIHTHTNAEHKGARLFRFRRGRRTWRLPVQ